MTCATEVSSVLFKHLVLILVVHYAIFLQSLLRTADQLKIKGLCESPEDSENPDDPSVPVLLKAFTRRSLSPKQDKPSNGGRRHRFKRERPEKITAQEDEEDEGRGLEAEDSSDEDNGVPDSVSEDCKRRKVSEPQTKPLNMSNHGILAGQVRNYSSIPTFPPNRPGRVYFSSVFFVIN